MGWAACGDEPSFSAARTILCDLTNDQKETQETVVTVVVPSEPSVRIGGA
jgi:hypothetical protein